MCSRTTWLYDFSFQVFGYELLLIQLSLVYEFWLVCQRLMKSPTSGDLHWTKCWKISMLVFAWGDTWLARKPQLEGNIFQRDSGPSTYQYRKSHCQDKIVIRSSHVHNGISYTSEMATLFWISPLEVSHYIYTYVYDELKFRVIYQWFNAGLQYFQCISNGDTAALH